jgi:ribosomal-protein-alanine N-acetyltransferase
MTVSPERPNDRSTVNLKTLRFEPITESHLAPILAIESQTNTAPWSERSFRNELNHPHGVFLVAILEGQVVGYGGTWLVIDEAHITTVAVAPEHQRKGIGRRLMVELLERAKAAGMLCSSLEVRAGNEAGIQLYERLGYAVTTRRKGYYPDNREDALVMWLHNLATWEPPSA